jgi:hypothetical protein
MTLVVARVAGSRIAVVADTLLAEHGRSLPFQDGIVKSCMLPGDLCASFANSPEAAAQAFAEFINRYPKGVGFSDAITYFLASASLEDLPAHYF